MSIGDQQRTLVSIEEYQNLVTSEHWWVLEITREYQMVLKNTMEHGKVLESIGDIGKHQKSFSEKTSENIGVFNRDPAEKHNWHHTRRLSKILHFGCKQVCQFGDLNWRLKLDTQIGYSNRKLKLKTQIGNSKWKPKLKTFYLETLRSETLNLETFRHTKLPGMSQ